MREVMEKIADHLAKQKRQSSYWDSCMYRGDNGAMCAVGVLFSDEAHTADGEPEDMSADELLVGDGDTEGFPRIRAEILAHFEGAEVREVSNLLLDIQSYHDSVHTYVDTYVGRLVEAQVEGWDTEQLRERILGDLNDIARRAGETYADH